MLTRDPAPPAPTGQPIAGTFAQIEVSHVTKVYGAGKFAKTVVREVMTPRPDIAAITKEAPVSELRRQMSESKYSRIVVYGENLDDVQGVVEVRDVELKVGKGRGLMQRAQEG